MKNIERITASILEINDSNDIYMTLNVLLLTSKTNLNGAKFLPDFIHEVVSNKEFYTGLPLVCEREKLENGKYNKLGHGINSEGEFTTAQIGSYVDFYEKQDKDGVWELYGVAKVYKRFKKVCSSVIELFNNNSLFFSIEAYVGNYKTKTKNVRQIGASEDNRLFGDCIVSFPAEVKSTARTVIAEALQYDLGGNSMNDMQKFNGFYADIKYSIENCELDFTQVQIKLYHKLEELLGSELYHYIGTDLGVDYLIMQKYDTGDYFKITYSVIDNDVNISDMVLVSKNYIPIEKTNSNKGDGEMTVAEVQLKLDTAELKIKELEKTLTEKDKIISEKEKVLSEKEKALSEKEEVLSEKEKVLDESETKINSLNENVNKLSETVVTKDNEISELLKAKEELDKINVEKAEKEKDEARISLKEKYSKLLSTEIMELEEISNAIKELNESVLQNKVVESALEKANTNDKSDIVTSSKVTDEISVGSSDVVSRYVTVNR